MGAANHAFLHAEEEALDRLSEQVDYLLKEINFYTWCLAELRSSADPEYRALYPIYEGLLAQRRAQLVQATR